MALVYLGKLLDDGLHLFVLLLHTLEELMLSTCAYKVVVTIGYLVVGVAIDIVHQEA